MFASHYYVINILYHTMLLKDTHAQYKKICFPKNNDKLPKKKKI